jgi:hypothetical protein
MMLSTVIEPMIERRWPLKMRPTRAAICRWSAWKRRAAALMLSGSSPTLNAMTARTPSVSPCWVNVSSTTSASCMARVRKEALRTTGRTKAPWPTTMRKGCSAEALRLPPEMSSASLGAGTR